MIDDQKVAVNVGSAGNRPALQEHGSGQRQMASDWAIALRVFERAALLLLSLPGTFACGLVASGSLPQGLARLLAAFSSGPLPSANRPQVACAVLVTHTYGSVCEPVPSEPSATQVHLQLLYRAGQLQTRPTATAVLVVEGLPRQVALVADKWVFLPNAPGTGAAEVVVRSARAVGETVSLQVSVQSSATVAMAGQPP